MGLGLLGRPRAAPVSHLVGIATGLLLVTILPVGGGLAIAPGPVSDSTSAPLISSAAASLNWSKLATGPIHPPGLAGASMVYDPIDGYVLLFGGLNYTGSGAAATSNATWIYHGGVWAKLNASPAPSSRYLSAMAFDAGDGYVLLFGGLHYQASTSTPSPLNDTWMFLHGAWTRLHPKFVPSARESRWAAVMAYDPVNRTVVLGGGDGCGPGGIGCGNLTDEWEYHRGQWTQFSGWQPFAGPYASMGYDVRDRELIYFAGCGAIGGGSVTVFSNGTWIPLAVSGSPPGPCWTPLPYAPTPHMLVYFLSFLGGGSPIETWGYHGGTWTNLTHGGQPSGRSLPSAAYDAVDGYLLLFGGELLTRGSPLTHDTWVLK
jgi:hypothetical protein